MNILTFVLVSSVPTARVYCDVLSLLVLSSLLSMSCTP